MSTKFCNKTLLIGCLAFSWLFFSTPALAQQHGDKPVKPETGDFTSERSPVFTSKEGGFSVRFPGEPKVKDEPINSKSGPVTLHTFTLEKNEGKVFYEVGYSDYDFTLEAASLNGVIDSQLASLKGRITSDKVVTLNGHPGRSVTMETGDFTFYSTVYTAGSRLYQVMFGMGSSDPMPVEATDFLDSFRILN